MTGLTVSVSDTESVSDTVIVSDTDSVSDRSPKNEMLGLRVGSANNSASSSSTDIAGGLRVAAGGLWDLILGLFHGNLEEFEELVCDQFIVLESLGFRIEIGKKLMSAVRFADGCIGADGADGGDSILMSERMNHVHDDL